MSTNLFELSVKPNSGSVEHYLLAVPKSIGENVAAYLKQSGCKFTGRYSIHRAGRQEFHIESAPTVVIERLAERTLANHGKVNLGNSQLTSTNAPGIEVDLSVCPLMEDQVISIKINGSEDFLWNAVPNMDIKLATFIQMAIQGIERDIVYYCDNKDERILDVFKSCGFTYCPDDISTMRYFNT